MRSAGNSISLVKKLPQFVALRAYPVAAINNEDHLLLKMTFFEFFKVL